MARISTKPCACGTFLRTMEKVRGRIANHICINGHEMHLRDFDEILLRFSFVLDYQLTVRENNVLHLMLVLSNKEDFEGVKTEIIQRIRDHFHVDFELFMEVLEDDHSSKITNSMIKRKLQDCRQGAII